jgi:hypothetical protein
VKKSLVINAGKRQGVINIYFKQFIIPLLLIPLLFLTIGSNGVAFSLEKKVDREDKPYSRALVIKADNEKVLTNNWLGKNKSLADRKALVNSHYPATIQQTSYIAWYVPNTGQKLIILSGFIGICLIIFGIGLKIFVSYT